MACFRRWVLRQRLAVGFLKQIKFRAEPNG
jgi:hypothetical protein